MLQICVGWALAHTSLCVIGSLVCSVRARAAHRIPASAAISDQESPVGLGDKGNERPTDAVGPNLNVVLAGRAEDFHETVVLGQPIRHGLGRRHLNQVQHQKDLVVATRWSGDAGSRCRLRHREARARSSNSGCPCWSRWTAPAPRREGRRPATGRPVLAQMCEDHQLQVCGRPVRCSLRTRVP